MDNRPGALPRQAEPRVQLADGVAQRRHDGFGQRHGGTQPTDGLLESLALDVFHDDIELFGGATALDDPRQVLETSPGLLCAEQALVRAADPRVSGDPFSDERSERSTAGPFEHDELGRLGIGRLERTDNTIAVAALDRCQIAAELVIKGAGCLVVCIHR